MVKCLECGFEGPRLQWTHFKYKCTGRFNNGKEYKLAYPGAEIVSKEVAKSTAITLENLIRKYGNMEGNTRWEQYKNKQAYSNSLEYKKEKYGWTEEQFKKYNSSRSQTLEKMIERHGEIHGATKWEEYCIRQGYTNTKEYFTKTYGTIIGTRKYLEINHKKAIPHNPELLAKHLDISNEEATQIIVSRHKSLFTSNLEKEFTNMLIERIGELEHTSFNNPFGKWSNLLNTYVVYDIKHKNCIIEFNGDYWHANPKIYTDTAIIRGKTASDIWHRDMLKLKTVSDLGFLVMTVWEDDFKNDKIKTINKVTEWILKEQQLKV
jgi:hypothetical protein